MGVWSLGREDPLGRSMATFSSILAWWIPRTEDPGGLQSLELQSLAQLKQLVSHTRTTLYYQYFTTGFCGCFVFLNLFWTWTTGSPESLKAFVIQQGGRQKKKKIEASDSSNLEIIVTGNFSLYDPLQLGHFCCHNLSTNLKMIDCHSTVYSNVLKIQEGLLHLGSYTVFIKRMWTTVLFLCLVVSC